MLIALGLLLLALMLAVGGERGAKSFAALIENILVLFACLYLISLGVNAVLMTLLCSILFASITLTQQNGINIKTYAAVFSVFTVVVLLCIPAFIIGYGAHIAGYSELDLLEEISMYLSVNIDIDMRELVFAVIIFGLLGAVMDTAIAISTSMTEFSKNNPSLTFRDLTRSGINVGHDILGTTVNTLFFAGIGECMMQAILFIQYGYTFEKLINSKAFIQELSMIAISNIGCLLIIPIVTFVTGYLLTSKSASADKIRAHILQKEKE